MDLLGDFGGAQQGDYLVGRGPGQGVPAAAAGFGVFGFAARDDLAGVVDFGARPGTDQPPSGGAGVGVQDVVPRGAAGFGRVIHRQGQGLFGSEQSAEPAEQLRVGLLRAVVDDLQQQRVGVAVDFIQPFLDAPVPGLDVAVVDFGGFCGQELPQGTEFPQ